MRMTAVPRSGAHTAQVHPERFAIAPKVQRAGREAQEKDEKAQRAELRVALLRRELDLYRDEVAKFDQSDRVQIVRGGFAPERMSSDEAVRRGSGAGRHVHYHRDTSEELKAAENEARMARKQAEHARTMARKLALNTPMWDPVEEARKVGAKWFATRQLRLAGRMFDPGEPIRPVDYDGLDQRKVRAILNVNAAPVEV